MASGILGNAALQSGEYTPVYIVPEGAIATVNISLCNAGNTPAIVRLALCEGLAPEAGEFIEYGMSLYPGDSFERTGIALQGDRSVIAYAEKGDGVNISVYGFEEKNGEV